MRVLILDSAFADLSAGRDFYDRHGREVGDYFVDALAADIDSLVLYAGLHSVKHGFHRMLATRFPYAIYYRRDGEAVTVYRVLDMRRDPARTHEALRGKP